MAISETTQGEPVMVKPAGIGADNRPTPKSNGLSKAEIVGYFSLPHASLAEHNPSAYAIAMSHAPKKSGTCSHCGTGILHHVVIRDETGTVRFIGTTCATAVGCDPEQIRDRLTDHQLAERDARRERIRNENLKVTLLVQEEIAARRRRRWESVSEIVHMLRSKNTTFHISLAEQLTNGPLTYKQARHVARLTSATGRRSKKNAAAWDAIENICMEEIN